MHQVAEASPEYVVARQVLLDALEALRPHEAAIVLAGAQAVYLRTGPAALPIAEFTTDGDLALDPALLGEAPPLATLMEASGFTLAERQGSPEPGIWEKTVQINGITTSVTVDLIVPMAAASGAGSRDARLPHHGKRAARKIRGLEAVLIDNDLMVIEALEPGDRRSARLRVAGVAALLISKAHKINDRVERGRMDRLQDKDAADVIRLMGATRPPTMADVVHRLLSDSDAGPVTEQALGYIGGLFGSRSGTGIEMASRALRGAMPLERVRAICIAWTGELTDALNESGRAPRP